jgi:hypothetical protein
MLEIIGGGDPSPNKLGANGEYDNYSLGGSHDGQNHDGQFKCFI